MRSSLALKLLVLLLVTGALSLSAAFIFRHLIIGDFRSYREGEREDRVYWVTARLEGEYDRQRGWQQHVVADQAVWALLLGMETRLLDRSGRLLTDSTTALNGLSTGGLERVLAVSGYVPATARGAYIPYPLFVAGEEIGRLEVRFLDRNREELFLLRASRFLLWSSLLVGGLAVLLAVIASRRLTRPLAALTAAAEAIGRGELASRAPAHARDEIGRLGQTFNLMAENLEKQEGLRRKLFANAAHELRTPLAAMRCELEGMLDGLIPQSREQLQSLRDEINRLAGFLQGMEDLARAEASALSLHRQRLDLCPFLSSIVERYRPLFSEKGVALALDCQATATMEADHERLSQVMVNLLGNALKATGAGGRVTVRGGMQDSAALIEVIDTGGGIADEDMPRIFERFYRGPQGGMGLGLTIVKELVAAHGGRIEVESRPGEGSKFSIIVPSS